MPAILHIPGNADVTIMLFMKKSILILIIQLLLALQMTLKY